MARSLTIKHEEKPSTSLLLNGFLLLAFLVMLTSTLAGAFAGDDAPAQSPVEVSIIR